MAARRLLERATVPLHPRAWYQRIPWGRFQCATDPESTSTCTTKHSERVEVAPPNTILLFLDFDGVLHHWFPRADRTDEQNQYFAYLPRVEAVVRDFPVLQVVVSSDWRLTRSLDELRAFFSEDIRPRVIGKTPSLGLPEGTPAPRQREIEAFLREQKLEGTPWIAVDDHADNFEPDAPLILCNDEFAEREEGLLRAAIRELLL